MYTCTVYLQPTRRDRAKYSKSGSWVGRGGGEGGREEGRKEGRTVPRDCCSAKAWYLRLSPIHQNKKKITYKAQLNSTHKFLWGERGGGWSAFNWSVSNFAPPISTAQSNQCGMLIGPSQSLPFDIYTMIIYILGSQPFVIPTPLRSCRGKENLLIELQLTNYVKRIVLLKLHKK